MLNYFILGLLFIIKAPYYIILGLINIIILPFKYIFIGSKYIIKKETIKDIDNNFINMITTTLSIISYLLCIFILTRWYVQSERSKYFTDSLLKDITQIEEIDNNNDVSNEYKDLELNNETNNQYTQQEDDENFLNVNLDYYINKNNETVGWLKVNGTNINYPIVQHNDNSYYLEHDFYNRNSANGWVFADYRDDLDTLNNNTIIYAHNLINKIMFGQVPYLLKKNWFKTKSNQYIKLSTKTTNSIWQIFSVYTIEPTTDYLQSNFNSITSYQEFLDKIQKRSEQKFKNVSLDYTDKIITLSTCNNAGNKRVVVHAKLINIEDK